MIFEVIITNKTLKIIVFYNVGGSRTVYIDGENVGDMYDNIGIGLDVFFEKIISADYFGVETYIISVYDNNLDSQLDEYEYDLILDWLDGAKKISNEQQIYLINGEWENLYISIGDENKNK